MSSTASELINQIFDMLPEGAIIDVRRFKGDTLVVRAEWVNENSVKKQFLVIDPTVDEGLMSIRDGLIEGTTYALTTGEQPRYTTPLDRSRMAVGDMYCRRERR